METKIKEILSDYSNFILSEEGYERDPEICKNRTQTTQQLLLLVNKARLDEARGYHLSNTQFDDYEIVWINNGTERTHEQRLAELRLLSEEK